MKHSSFFLSIASRKSMALNQITAGNERKIDWQEKDGFIHPQSPMHLTILADS